VLGRLLDDSYADSVRRNVSTVTVARLVANALYRFAGPFVAVTARGLDVSIGELGAALTIAELCGLLSPVVGRIVDHVSRRAAMTFGLLGMAAGATVVAAATHVVVFATGLFVLSWCKIFYDVGQGSWITDHVPFARRGRVVGLTETSWALGLLVGVSAMGLISSAWSWSWSYAAGGAFALVMAAVVWRRIGPDDVAHRPVRPPRGSPRPPIRLGRAGWLVLAAMASMTAASQLLFVTFGAWLEDDHGFTSATLAAVTFMIGGLELISSSLSTARVDHWGKERSVAGGAVVMIVAGVAFVALHGVLALGLVTLGVFIASFEFSIVSVIPIGGDLVPGRPGAGLSRGLASSAIGRALATLPATMMYERAGIGWCALAAVLLAAVIALSMTWRLRLLERARPAPAVSGSRW